jgi:prepilin-type N-terminal cleavage/methylation domain-containing protein
MSRRGFTLTELLVATIVFMVGFVSVFALFLGGMRMRKMAEDTTRSSLAASCLIDEIRIDAGEGGVALKPKSYVGDGFARSSQEDGEISTSGIALEAPLFPYKPIPGTWYRVLRSTDLEDNAENAQTTVLKLDLLVVPFGSQDDSLTFLELDRRLDLLSEKTQTQRKASTPEEVAARLVQRGIGFRFVAVVTRRPSWMPARGP